MGIFNKFSNGLKKTSDFISSGIINSLKSNNLNDEVIEEIENVLISSDIGLDITNELINKIKSLKIKDDKKIEYILNVFSDEITKILLKCEKGIFEENESQPSTFIFIGVNGSGKTTTIGKLIKKIDRNKKILIAACDTFRAAAIDQLKQWSKSENALFFEGKNNQDPASVAFGACEKVKNEKCDYLFIDTAGRLSNNTNLLNQLIKIKNVTVKSQISKKIKTILVLDGTNGSNMVKQVEIFSESLDVTGLIITKLDGTAKGGALITIAKKYQLPIHYVGLGESEDDLYEFNAREFSKSLLGLSN